MRTATLTVSAVALILTVLLPGAGAGTARPGADRTGVTATSVTLGGTVPLSGPESAYAPVARGADAYFKYVNARGGVHGRKIRYRYLDDAYDPSRTVQATRQLVQQHRVFAIFNSVGTEHAIAVRAFLNAAKVPQLFVGSGAAEIARQARRFPWTMGYLPSFVGEGKVHGRYIARTRPRARIAVLYEDSEYGKELLAGLRAGLGRRARAIVATQTYEVTDIDVSSQLARLKASRADTLVLFSLPKQTLQALVRVDKLGWRPRVSISAVSIDPFVMGIAHENTKGRTTNGAVSMAFLNDPTDPTLAKTRGVRLYRTIMRRYLRGVNEKQVAHLYGMAVAFTMVDTLRRAGKNLTRESLRRAATHLNERNNPFLRRGITVRTAPNDYFPIEQVQMVRYRNGRWVPFGRLVRAR